MVIKGSAAKRDGERLHPAADVEQEGKKEKRGDGGERMGVCGGKDGGGGDTAEKGQGGKRENRERERDKEGLNGDRK